MGGPVDGMRARTQSSTTRKEGPDALLVGKDTPQGPPETRLSGCPGHRHHSGPIPVPLYVRWNYYRRSREREGPR